MVKLSYTLRNTGYFRTKQSVNIEIEKQKEKKTFQIPLSIINKYIFLIPINDAYVLKFNRFHILPNF